MSEVSAGSESGTAASAEGGTSRRLSPLAFAFALRNPAKFLQEIAIWPGDVAHVKVGKLTAGALKHPELVQKVLVAESAKFEKGRTLERALFFRFLGDGLLNSRGEAHRRQRRLVLPAFHRTRLAGYSQTIAEAATTVSARWRDGDEPDIATEMSALTLSVVGRTFFSSPAGSEALSQAFEQLTAHINRLTFPGARWLLRTPLPFARKIRASEATLNEVVYRLIHERRASKQDTGDLLSMLLLAEDAEKSGDGLTDTEIRDQVMTIFFAGQETTANALTWTWWLLARHPEIEKKLHAELAEVLGGRKPLHEDYPRLRYTQQIVREVLRLYPPIWAMGRRALEDVEFLGFKFPRGSLLIASQWINHRDARYYTEPNEFRPERWTSEFTAALPRFAYFPFGGGPRSCMGEGFAWMELVLIIATLAQTWQLKATPDSAHVQPDARITLQANRAVRLRLKRRS
jgi:cytochrome P450